MQALVEVVIVFLGCYAPELTMDRKRLGHTNQGPLIAGSCTKTHLPREDFQDGMRHDIPKCEAEVREQRNYAKRSDRVTSKRKEIARDLHVRPFENFSHDFYERVLSCISWLDCLTARFPAPRAKPQGRPVKTSADRCGHFIEIHVALRHHVRG